MRRHLIALSALALVALAGCAAEQMGKAGVAPAAPATPTVTLLRPAEGAAEGGTLLVIHGTNLPRDAVVSFPTGAPFDVGPLATQVAVSGSGDAIACVTPPGEPGRLAPVLIRSASAGSVVHMPGFRYLAGPTARAVTPAEGPMSGGTALVIAGEQLAGGCAVTVGGIAATGVSAAADGRSLTCVTPPRATWGAVDVAVAMPGRATWRMAGAFRYQPPPRVDALNPPAGPQRGGTLVSIDGEGFRGELAVRFGGVAATGVVASADGRSVRCRAPARDAAGAVDVVVSASITGSVTASAAFTYAAEPWERVGEGLDGGDVTALASASADVVYAGTRAGGVFRSADGGASWVAASWPAGRGGRFVAHTLVVEPGAPDVVYAAGFDQLARSEDGGATWVALDAALPAGGRFANAPLVIDGAGALLFGLAGGGVWRSTDRGAAWSDVSAGLPSLDVCALALDPAAAGVAYAGTLGGAVARSVDGGLTWAPASAGLAGSGPVRRLIVHPTISGTVYALVAGVVFRTRDSGASWTAVTAGLPGAASELALAPAALYAAMADDGRVFRSVDGANSWQLASGGLPVTDVCDLVPVAGSAGAVLAGTAAGVWRTADAGGAWAPSQRGLRALALADLTADPVQPGLVYAAAERGTALLVSGASPVARPARGGGVWRSADHGRTWTASSEGLSGSPVTRLAVDAAAPSTLVAVSGGVPFRSRDGARTWAPGVPLPATVSALRFDGRVAGVAYAAVSGATARVLRTLTAGEEWTDVSAGLTGARVTDLLVDPRGEPAVYAAGAGRGVMRLREGAWADVSAGLVLASPGELAAGPGAELLVMLGAPFRSDDGAETWTASDAGVDPRDAVLVVTAPSDRAIAYAASRAKVYRSSDGGRTWRTLPYPAPGPIVRMAVDPRTPDVVYVGQSDGQFYRSFTSGE